MKEFGIAIALAVVIIIGVGVFSFKITGSELGPMRYDYITHGVVVKIMVSEATATSRRSEKVLVDGDDGYRYTVFSDKCVVGDRVIIKQRRGGMSHPIYVITYELKE